MSIQENSQNVGLLNKTQAAKRLGICVRTLDNRMADLKLPYVQIGKSIRFIPADIENYIQSHRIGK
jgi:predicted DNA-binding transcriptional regulator AlpA